MKHLKNFRVYNLSESTSSYFPGYSDDGTADNLSAIHKKSDKVFNKELEKLFDTYLKVKYDDELLWNKWCFSNMVLTALSNYIHIKRSIIDKVVEYYKELEKDSNIKIMFKDHKESSAILFKKSMIVINQKLKEMLEYYDKQQNNFEKDGIKPDRKYVYAPYFLNSEEDIKLKKEIDNKK